MTFDVVDPIEQFVTTITYLLLRGQIPPAH